jgi:hypothetical protein
MMVSFGGASREQVRPQSVASTIAGLSPSFIILTLRNN